MAAGTWKLFDKAKYKIGLGTITLGASGHFRMGLLTSASHLKTTASARAYSCWSALIADASQVASANGYCTSGKTLGTTTWTSIATGIYRFNASALGAKWSATGAISNIKYACIFASAAAAANCHVLCYATLSTAAISLANTNTLSVKPSATGFFNLS